MNKVKMPLQILASLWIIYIFGGSLPYKFSSHEHTQNIFGGIGDWMSGFLGSTIWNAFGNYGAYVIGSLELIVSLMLLAAIVMTIMKKPAGHLFGMAGFGAAVLMAGAVFFHLAAIGIEVNGDGWSLFRAAVSILIIGSIMNYVNYTAIKAKMCKK